MSMYKAQRLLAEAMRNHRKQQQQESSASHTRSFADKSYQNCLQHPLMENQHRRLSQPVNQNGPRQIHKQGKQQPAREPLRQCPNGQRQLQHRSVSQKVLPSAAADRHGASKIESIQEENTAACKEVVPAVPSRLPCLDRSAALPVDVPDADQRGHCTMVTAYAKDIFVYLAERELAYRLPSNILSGHDEVTERSRAVLVDWLLQLCGRFELQSDTYHLSVRLLDHYLAVDSRVTKHQLQPLGAAALWLASKLEEVYCISLGDLLHVCAGACGRRDLLTMETRLIGALDFYLLPPLPITFLRRLSKIAGIDNRLHFIAKYLLELATLSTELSCRPASQLAAAALRVSLGSEFRDWSNQLTFYSGYTGEALRSVCADLARALFRAAAGAESRQQQQQQQHHHHHHRFVYQKYHSAKCLSVAACSQLQPDSPYLARLIDDADAT